MRQPHPTGQFLFSAYGTRYWFDSGSLALDFAYTGTIGDNPAWESLRAPSDLGAWVADRFDGVGAAASGRELSEREFTDALGLRAAIARSAVAISRGEEPAGEDVDVINLFAATPDIPPVLPGGRRQAGRSRPRLGQALSVIARESVELLAAEEHDRIRTCSAADCQIVFYDESRSNNRRWCSMQNCGNRAKVRAHRRKGSAVVQR